MFLVVAAAVAFHTGSFSLSLIQVGDIWVHEPLVATESVAIDKTADSLAVERARVRRNTEPIFEAYAGVEAEIAANLDTLQQQMDAIMRAHHSYRLNRERIHFPVDTTDTVNYQELADADSLRYLRNRQRARVYLSDSQWQMLNDNNTAYQLSLTAGVESTTAPLPMYQQMLDRVRIHATAFSRTNVLDVPLDTVYTEYLKVRNVDASTFERVSKSSVFSQDQVYRSVEEDLAGILGESTSTLFSLPLLSAVYMPSLRYDHGATERARQQAEQNISSTRGMIAEDEIVVRTGEVITPEIRQRLESIDRMRSSQAGPAIYAPRSMGKLLLAFCTLGIFFVFIYVIRQPIFASNKKMLLITLLFAVIIGLFALVVRRDITFIFAVPTLLVSVVLTLVLDSRVGLFSNLCLALLGGLIMGTEAAFVFVFATIVAGTLAVYTVRGARTRAKFFVSAGSAFAGYFVVFLGFWLFQEVGWTEFLGDVATAGINCFLLIAAFPLLWVFERTFDLSSELRLVELSDFNHPLLKRLQQSTPGTFNHSLQVASLAEAAAESIGAHVLLTRVGALFHDVGKMEQSQFFAENQRAGYNPHNEISPYESAQIIKNHVTAGIALAEKFGLPSNIAKFIPMHHGTTRIEYFYHKAKEQGGEVNEADFRYAGPRPDSKETGIMMLSDAVEAACKSITESTVEAFEERIDAVFQARINDGQLDDALLTFRDLKTIKETFIKQLSAMYHVRVKYPGQK